MCNSIRNPFKWLKMLIDELHWSFVLGVVFVYGISQGLGAGLSKLSIQYYMKDDLRVQPSESQIYFGLMMIPWIGKPLWGFITDTVPIFGYRRRPYFVFAGNNVSICILFLPNLISIVGSAVYPQSNPERERRGRNAAMS